MQANPVGIRLNDHRSRVAAPNGENSRAKPRMSVNIAGLAFRRTYSSWAHEKGVPGKVVATLMGHAKVDTTLNVYTQVLEDSLRGAAEKVGSELITIDHKTGLAGAANQPER